MIGHHIRGGFGAKLDASLERYAALFARNVGRPVKLVKERSEDLLTCGLSGERDCPAAHIADVRRAGSFLARRMC
jgi:CO/xanthine dehydrogenase Mo-binding subunit